MTSKDLNIMLTELLPEIKASYDEEVSWQEGDETGSHVVFGDVLLPYILKSIESENTQCLIKCFKMIEKISEGRKENLKWKERGKRIGGYNFKCVRKSFV